MIVNFAFCLTTKIFTSSYSKAMFSRKFCILTVEYFKENEFKLMPSGCELKIEPSNKSIIAKIGLFSATPFKIILMSLLSHSNGLNKSKAK